MSHHQVYCVKPENGQPSNILQKAFNALEKGDLDPKWIEAKECLNFQEKKSKVAFIADPFNGPAFENLSTQGNRIYGPPCILECLKNAEALPKVVHPVYSQTMKGLNVCCTGLLNDEKELVEKRVKWMAGDFDAVLTRAITHLVTGKVGSKKYLVAGNLGIKIMSPAWVNIVWEACSKRNISIEDDEFAKLRCPIFKDLVVTVSGLDQREREEVKMIVQAEGGRYTGEMKVNDCTHLLVKEPKGQKYEFARKWKIVIADLKWLHDSVDKGYCLDEALYPVKKSKKMSTPKKDKKASLSCFDSTANMSSIHNFSTLSSITTMDETAPSKIPGGPLDDLDITVFSGDMFLDGCKIFLSGFNDVELEKLWKVINLGGGTRFSQINESISHVVIGERVKDHIDQLKAANFRPHVVRSSWLIDSFQKGEMMPEVDYLCLELPPVVNPLSPPPKSNSFLRPAQVKPAIKPATVSKPTVVEEADEMQELLSQYMPTGSQDVTVLPQEEIPEPVASTSKGDVTLDPDVTRDPDATCDPQAEEEEGNLFKGQLFVVLGFTPQQERELAEYIHEGGGRIVPSRSRAVPNYGVVPVFGCPVNVTVDEVVTNIWLQMCIEEDTLIPLEEELLFKPVPRAPNSQPLKDCVMSISSFSGVLRDCLFHIAEELGACVREFFNKKSVKGQKGSTHLLIQLPDGLEGQKYQAAVKWGVPVVTKEWLLECCRTGARVPEVKYSPEAVMARAKGNSSSKLEESAKQYLNQDSVTHVEDIEVQEIEPMIIKQQTPKQLAKSTHVTAKNTPGGAAKITPLTAKKTPLTTKSTPVGTAIKTPLTAKSTPVGTAKKTSLTAKNTPVETAKKTPLTAKNTPVGTAKKTSLTAKSTPVGTAQKPSLTAKSTPVGTAKKHLTAKSTPVETAQTTPVEYKQPQIPSTSANTEDSLQTPNSVKRLFPMEGFNQLTPLGQSTPQPGGSKDATLPTFKTPIGTGRKSLSTPRSLANLRVKRLQEASLSESFSQLSPHSRGIDSPSKWLNPDVPYQPSFDISELLAELATPEGQRAAAQRKQTSESKKRRTSSNMDLDELFTYYMEQGLKKMTPMSMLSFNEGLEDKGDTNDHDDEDKEKKVTQGGGDADDASKANPLRGVIIGVSKKLNGRQAELNRLAASLGADYRWTYDQSCTHFIHQGRSSDNSKEYKIAKEQKKIIVSPYWLTVCQEQNAHVDESLFPHNYNPNMSLSVISTTADTPTHGTRRSSRILTKPQMAASSPSQISRAKTRSTIDVEKIEEERVEVAVGLSDEELAQVCDNAEENNDDKENDSDNSPQDHGTGSLEMQEAVSKQLEDFMAATKAQRPGRRISKRFNSNGSEENVGSNDSTDKGRPPSRPRSKLAVQADNNLSNSARSSGSTKTPEPEFSQHVEVTWDDPTGRQEQEKLASVLHKPYSPTQESLSPVPPGCGEDHGHTSDRADYSMSLKNMGPVNSPLPDFKPPPTPEAPPLAFPRPKRPTTAASPEAIVALDEYSGGEVRSGPPKFLLSGIDQSERTTYGALIEELGGQVHDGPNCDLSCTHLIAGNCTRNEKYLACVAAGKWILHKSYLEACREAGEFVKEDNHEWGGDSTAGMKSLTAQNLNLAHAAKRWRIKLQEERKRNPECVGAFQDWGVILCCGKSREGGFKRLLTAGGAKVLHTRPPFTNLQEATFAFIDPRKVEYEVDYQKLVDGGVHCVKPDYISAYLQNDPFPRVEDLYVPEVMPYLTSSSGTKRKSSGSGGDVGKRARRN